MVFGSAVVAADNTKRYADSEALTSHQPHEYLKSGCGPDVSHTFCRFNGQRLCHRVSLPQKPS
jgi:hypothetical protein